MLKEKKKNKKGEKTKAKGSVSGRPYFLWFWFPYVIITISKLDSSNHIYFVGRQLTYMQASYYIFKLD